MAKQAMFEYFIEFQNHGREDGPAGANAQEPTVMKKYSMGLAPTCHVRLAKSSQTSAGGRALLLELVLFSSGTAS
ncbi:MAG: hypothetical protein V3T17_03615 [Pseudomonadales bacterium]